MTSLLEDHLSVTHPMGGLIELQETGIYPDKLRIFSEKYNHTWRIKVKDENQNGVLHIKRVPVYNYILINDRFKVQIVSNGNPSSEWFDVSVNTIMQN